MFNALKDKTKNFLYRVNPSLKKIIFLWKPYKLLIFVTFISLIIFAVMEGISLTLIYTVFNQTAQSFSLSTPPTKIFNFITFTAKYIPIKDMFVLACVLLILSYLIKSVFAFLSQFVSFYLSTKTKRDFHDKIFRKFLRCEYSFFLNHKHGWLMHRTMTVPLDASLFLDYIPRMAVNAFKIIAIIVTLFFISPKVTFFIIILAVFYYYAAKVIASKISYHIGKDKVNELQTQNELAAEAFAGIKQIKVSLSADSWASKFWTAALKYSRLEITDSIWILFPPIVMEFVLIAALTLALIILKVYYANSFIAVLPIVATFGYGIQRIIPTFNLLGAQRVAFGGLMPVLEIIYDILSMPDKKEDGSIEIKDLNQKIAFRNVCFTYPGRDLLFSGLNFDIEKGKTTAIVGPSGSGKSTIVDLILRFWRVLEGEILIDNIDLNSVEINSWLGKIGLVSQDTFIFHGTIKDNIGFGFDKKNFDEVMAAAKDANAHDFIIEFPQKYDTVVGDRGLKLSGGQRQRIAIARALLRKPEILILDEATSSLDNASEAMVQDAINKVSKNRTVIVIAHRLSTIINADKIIVLDQGKVVEEGVHQELIDKKGFYGRLYNIQRSLVQDNKHLIRM